MHRPEEDSLHGSQGPLPHENAGPLFEIVKKSKMVTGEHYTKQEVLCDCTGLAPR